jgi:hypothetical protein
MAGIKELTKAALAEVFMYAYNKMPEFAVGREPDTYAVYFIRDKPANFASGVYLAKSYWVSVSIISLKYDRTLYRQVEKAFANAGFTYAGGTDVSGYEETSPYPHRYQYSQEYLISMDLEE